MTDVFIRISALDRDLVQWHRLNLSFHARHEPVNLKNANHGIKTGKFFFTKTPKYVVKTGNKLLS